jgi:secreted trypsin-like serine protease
MGVGQGFYLQQIEQQGRIKFDNLIQYVKTDDETENHDIVLLRLSQPISTKFSRAKTACIASELSTNSNQTLLYGWGSAIPSRIDTEPIGGSTIPYWLHYPNSLQMQQMSAQIVPNNNSTLKSENFFWIEANGTTKVPCQGDFGNPIHQTKEGKIQKTIMNFKFCTNQILKLDELQVVGILSGTEFSGNNYRKNWECQGPISVIRLSYYRDWIERHVGKVFCD